MAWVIVGCVSFFCVVNPKKSVMCFLGFFTRKIDIIFQNKLLFFWVYLLGPAKTKMNTSGVHEG